MKTLEGRSKPFIVSAGLVLVAIIGIVDYVTGAEVALSIMTRLSGFSSPYPWRSWAPLSGRCHSHFEWISDCP